MSSPRVLIIDDEADIRALLEMTLSRMGLETDSAENVSSAMSALNNQKYDLCLTDMRLPDGLGLDIIAAIQKQHTGTPVAVITAYGNAEDAVNSLKAGAFDFVTKPVNIEVLRRLVDSALELSRDEARPNLVEQQETQLIGATPPIQQLRKTIAKLARNQAPVHVNGESGSGKELVARMIHEQGPRKDKPFIAVNCGAIPSELMESEFFGHLKGSFTGAGSDKAGLFHAADGGTLFLDEVADLPLHMQVKLLRAIQERSVRRVGGNREEKVDVRLISATHKDLLNKVQNSEFREDLYYRLNVIEVIVPPLRERRDDIATLAEFLIGRIAERHNVQPPSLSKTAANALYAYDFPGNIRELENVLERASALCEDNIIEPSDLSLQARQQQIKHGESASIDQSLAQTERQRIIEALEKTRYNKTKAAELLGISFRSLRYRLQKLNID